MASFANLKNCVARDGQLHKVISQKQVPEFFLNCYLFINTGVVLAKSAFKPQG